MRCLALAECARQMGASVCFITADEQAQKIVAERGFESVCLESAWEDLDREIPAMRALIQTQGIRRLVVDSYYVTEEYLSALRELTEVTYIDDLNRFPYPVDRLINYNFYGPATDYRCPGKPEYLLGPGYAPLRAEFAEPFERSFEKLSGILVTSGGTDPYKVAGSVLERLTGDERFAGCDIYCVLGRFHAQRETFAERYRDSGRVHILVNIPDMEHYMRICDVAVTAGGTTTYEICACGLPALVYTMADNQLEIARSADRLGIMPWIGDVRDDMPGCLDRMVSELLRMEAPDCRRAISEKMRAVSDGRGAFRLAERILST